MFVETLERLYRLLFGPPNPTNGCSLSAIRQAEAALGVRLPEPLRQYYLRFGENKVLAGAQDLLLMPEMLEIEERHLVFWQENQQVYLAGIPVDLLAQQDPPVMQQGTEDDAPWYPECRRLSDFLLRTVCWQATWGMHSQARAERLEAAVFDRVAARVPRVAPEEPYEHELVGFAAEGLVVCAFPHNGALYVGARNDERLREFERDFVIPLSWLKAGQAEPQAAADGGGG